MDYSSLINFDNILDMLAEIGSIMNLSEFCNKFLVILNRVVPFDNGHFIFYDPENNLLPISYRYNIDGKIHNQYLEYYRYIDQFIDKAFNTPEPKRSTDIMEYSQWEKTEYFNDFHLKNQFYYIAIADIHYRNRLLSSISLIRNKHSYDFTFEDLTYLKLLTPHIANHMYKLLVIEKQKNTSVNNILRLINDRGNEFLLTDREHEIVNSVIKGKSNAEISDHLYISSETVKKHLNSIFKKTNVSNRTELLALLLGLI